MPPFSLLLLACTPAATDSAWVDPAADDDWSGDIDSAGHVAEWDGDGVSAAFDDALAGGLPVPQTVLTSYLELLSHMEDGCPGTEFSEGFVMLGGCTTSEGYTFRGSAGLIRSDARVYQSDGSWTGSFNLMTAPADYVIERPDGTALEAGGTLGVTLTRDNTLWNWNASITGTMKDDGGTGWLATGYSGKFDLRGVSANGAVSQTLDGPLSVGSAALVFNSLEFDLNSCPDGAVGGSVDVRQPDATWYSVVLPDACGTCGALTWDAGLGEIQDLGEACLDFTPIVDAIPTVSDA